MKYRGQWTLHDGRRMQAWFRKAIRKAIRHANRVAVRVAARIAAASTLGIGTIGAIGTIGTMTGLLALGGCGVGQSITSSTTNAAKWAFTTQVKTMNVDLLSRAESNPDANGQPLATVIRLYQLTSATDFNKLNYAQLQSDDLSLLNGAVLASTSVVLRPGTSEAVTQPMHPDAGYVGVVAFFRDVDRTAVWKVVLRKSQWKQNSPVKLEVQGSQLRVVS